MTELTQAGYDALIEVSATGTFPQPDISAVALKGNLYAAGYMVFNAEEMLWRVTEEGRTAMLDFYLSTLSLFPSVD